jgi:hypothetical protein
MEKPLWQAEIKRIAADRQGKARGMSEPPLDALNRWRGALGEQQTLQDRAYLQPIRNSLHKPIEGRSADAEPAKNILPCYK